MPVVLGAEAGAQQDCGTLGPGGGWWTDHGEMTVTAEPRGCAERLDGGVTAEGGQGTARRRWARAAGGIDFPQVTQRESQDFVPPNRFRSHVASGPAISVK